MNTIYAISPDRQERIETIESPQVAKRIKMLQNQGYLKIKVIA